MPAANQIKRKAAASKWIRQSEKRSVRNLSTNTQLKTVFKKAKGSNDPALASAAESLFDKAVSRGIIHPNKAARKKSRLAKALAKQAAA